MRRQVTGWEAARRRHRRTQLGIGWGFGIAVIVILALNAFIWLPAVADCNARGGVLVTNAFNLPACVAGAGVTW